MRHPLDRILYDTPLHRTMYELTPAESRDEAATLAARPDAKLAEDNAIMAGYRLWGRPNYGDDE